MLNLGSGPCRVDDWLNVDRFYPVDVIADARTLPFGDGAFDRAYLGHLLEHVDRIDVGAVLHEARRVAAVIAVVVPDIPGWQRGHAGGVVSDVELAAALEGGRRYSGDEHRWWPSAEAMNAFPQLAPIGVGDLIATMHVTTGPKREAMDKL
jgi:hypothetical protein